MGYGNSTRHHIFVIIGLSFLVLAVFAALTPNVYARGSYLSAFTSRYPNAAGTPLDDCTVCHGASTSTWNPYGQDIRSQGSGVAIATRLANVEQDDSDGDGVPNLNEIDLGYFPGDAGSTPPVQSPPPPPPPSNNPPTANAGPDQTVTAGSDGTATVVLNGSKSSDADGPIASYSWSGLPSGTASGVSPTVSLSVGTYNITLTVTDSAGGADTDTVLVTVEPAQAPTPPPSEPPVAEPPPAEPPVAEPPPAEPPSTPPAAAGFSVTPAEGAVDVPIMVAVVTSIDGSGAMPDDITNGFTLTEDTPSLAAGAEAGDAQCVSNGIVNGSFAKDDPNTVTFTPDCPLANGATYTATIALEEPVTWSFTTIVRTADTDQDGVEDAEDERPDDDREATPSASKGEGMFRVSVRMDGYWRLRSVRGISDTHYSINQDRKPEGYEFRNGLVEYEVHGGTPGETVEVDIEYPEEIPSGSRVYRSDRDGFSEIPAVISGNRFTMAVTDGEAGDSDGQANGVVATSVGVAIPAAAGSGSVSVGTDAAGGGCSVTGAGGGWEEAAGSYGLLVLVWLTLALRRRKPGTGG